MFGVGEYADLRADVSECVGLVLDKAGPSQTLQVGAERTIHSPRPSSRRDRKERRHTSKRERAADAALDDRLEEPSVPVGGQEVGDARILRPQPR